MFGKLLRRKGSTVKVEKAEVVESKPELKEPQAFPEFLSKEHMDKIELLGAEIRNSQLMQAIQDSFLQNYQLQLENVTMRIEKQKEECARKNTEYENKKKLRTSYLQDLNKIYNFGDKLSYDPETGKIDR